MPIELVMLISWSITQAQRFATLTQTQRKGHRMRACVYTCSEGCDAPSMNVVAMTKNSAS